MNCALPNQTLGHTVQARLPLVRAESQTGIPDASVLEQADLLWDRLADFNATEIDAALDLLLCGLCKIANAQNACWLGATPRETLGQPSHSSFHRERYDNDGDSDVIYVSVPVNDDVESRFAIFRDPGQLPFSVREREAVTYALRGTKWFHRRLMLSYGLLVAESPVTTVERRVLKHLIGGLSEKQIAAEVGHSIHTTHEYVRNIYRKFGVNTRATLIALWLGKRA